jgi:hypothetical protein
VNKSQNHNQAKERTEQGLIQQVEPEAQSLGSEVTSKSGNWYDQTSQNGREDFGESFKGNKKGPLNIHLQVKRPDTPFVEGRKEKWGQSDFFNVMVKFKFSFQSIRQHAWFIWEVTFSERMEANTVWTALSSK